MRLIHGANWQLIVGDVMAGLASLPDNIIQTVVTSPPYWQQRDYGFDGQIGLEKTHQEYVQTIVAVFREVRRVLRDDGTLFLNLGDSYCKDSKFGGFSNSKNKPANDAGVLPQGYRSLCGMKRGNLVGIPWRVALALQEDGWILRQNIIWYKPAPMPESVSGWHWVKCRKVINTYKAANGTYSAESTPGKPHSAKNGSAFVSSEKIDCPGCGRCSKNGGYKLKKGMWRPTTSHEFVFMLSKSPEYFCDGNGSKEPVSGGAHSRGDASNPKQFRLSPNSSRQNMPKANDSFAAGCSDLVEVKNMRSVFRMAAEGSKENHFAGYPTELVRRCLSAAVSPAGCCSNCGTCYSPVVETRRVATRPGNDSKVGRVSSFNESPYNAHEGMVVGNRDPLRHTNVERIVGYRKSCSCEVSEPVRPVVLDPFSGLATTGHVAINMNCRYIGIEKKDAYAEISVRRLQTPWVPVSERRKKSGKKRTKNHKAQKELF